MENPKKYIVVEPIRWKRKKRMPGETIELPAAIGDPLVGRELAADSGTEVDEKIILEAIAKLGEDKSNFLHWTKTGLPQVGALEELTGAKVTAAMRDEAWKKFNEPGA